MNTSFIYNRASSNHQILTIVQSTRTLKQVNFTQNKGPIYLFHCQMNIFGAATLSGNFGGAIHAIQSRIMINTTERLSITRNIASLGGGILLRESELVIQSPVTISNNRAGKCGGGIYAYQSSINFAADKSIVTNNFAGQNGGGVCTIASTIKLSHSYVTIGTNTALISGGGIYLQVNSKIYLLKLEFERLYLGIINVRLEVSNNVAKFGGGIYVEDSSMAGGLQCRGTEDSMLPECFIQTIKLYQRSRHYLVNTVNTFLVNNTAFSGSALYGGLFDRCTASVNAEANYKRFEYFKNTVMFSSNSSISSDPLQVSFCGEDSPIHIRKGKAFTIQVVAH